MAIFKQIEARVLVDGQPLHEYDEPADDGDRNSGKEQDIIIEKYIESTPGANFVVNLKLNPGFVFAEHAKCDGLVYEVAVDGTTVSWPTITAEAYCSNPRGMTVEAGGIRTFRSGCWQIQKFRFLGLKFDDEAKNASLSVDQAEQLGCIKVTVLRKRFLSQIGPEASPAPQFILPTVSEKSLKGRANDTVTALDAGVVITNRTLTSLAETTHSKPLVTFKFKYYSRAALQNLGIIERPQSPTPLEDRDRDTLSLEDLRELVKRQKDLARSQEDTAKLLKRQLRATKNLNNIKMIDTLKRARSQSPIEGNNELQEVKRSKKDWTITVIELDD